MNAHFALASPNPRRSISNSLHFPFLSHFPIHPLNSAKDSLGCIGVGKNDKITLVGRGNTLGAAFALVNCYRAYGTQFGQEFAYRMVKMTLDRDTKCWQGLFVPALAIASM